MDKKIILVAIIGVIAAIALVYGISAISTPTGQITGQVASQAGSAISGNVPTMVGGC